ncbi:MAG: insulinase family protein [Nanoarchaeota archaeon]|nr:insulinase family protein [Nanoarchaeota archaeon]MBU1004372.1 insulinase family protein [Nanoarchaeota archaeon]
MLKNGFTVVLEKKPTETVTIQASVKTGSNNEDKRINGISHFIEHMLFEGTCKRPNSHIIANEIESLGGELNAYTSNERTCFYVKVPKNHFDKALDIISDLVQNSIFDAKNVEKERKVILKEIDMHKDEPRFHQWILFYRILFKKHPAGLAPYGTVDAVKKMTRKDLSEHYHAHYVPNNMILSVVGDFDSKALGKIKINFEGFKQRDLCLRKEIVEPNKDKVEVLKEKRDILSSYMVLGYRAVSRLDKDSYVLDVIKSILGRGQSGKIFDEIRNKRGLAYEVGVHNEPCSDYGFFAVYLNTDKKNIPKAISLILKEFDGLQRLSKKELEEAKGFLIGQHILSNEDTRDLADELGFWESIKDSKLLDGYLKEIEKVSLNDVARVAKKYLTKNYALAVVEQSK